MTSLFAAADANTLVCAHCSAALPQDRWNTTEVVCPGCRAPVTALVFPAWFRKDVPSAAAVAEEGDASCFYHSAKKAIVPCDQCGRFLCSLCQMEFQGQNWCPGCIENNRFKRKLPNLETRRTLYDSLALQLVTWPAIWPFTGLTIFTAPVALFVAIRYWKAPSSIVARSRIRLYVALALAILEIAGWAWLVLFMMSKL